MKFTQFLFFICFVSIIVACSDSQKNTSEGGQPLPGPTVFPPPGTDNNTAITSGDIVQHYTCPNNCEGSGGSVNSQCPVCGTQYVHNTAFHAQSNPITITPTTTPEGTVITSPSPSATIANDGGVFHHICPDGCEGGAATAGECATCGATLVHNAAFHQ